MQAWRDAWWMIRVKWLTPAPLAMFTFSTIDIFYLASSRTQVRTHAQQIYVRKENTFTDESALTRAAPIQEVHTHTHTHTYLSCTRTLSNYLLLLQLPNFLSPLAGLQALVRVMSPMEGSKITILATSLLFSTYELEVFLHFRDGRFYSHKSSASFLYRLLLLFLKKKSYETNAGHGMFIFSVYWESYFFFFRINALRGPTHVQIVPVQSFCTSKELSWDMERSHFVRKLFKSPQK